MRNIDIRVILAIFCLLFLAFTCKDEESPVTPSRNGSIEGTVIDDSTNLPIENANIYTVPATSNVTSNQYGEYKIDFVPYAEYKVYCYKTGFDTASVSVSLDTGAVAFADFNLMKTFEPVGSIKVVIRDVDSNLPIENVQVITEPATSILLTDENGTCFFQNISPGNYVLKTTHKNYTDQSLNINVQDRIETTANINLQLSVGANTGSIRVFARDVSSNSPIENVQVVTVPATSILLTDSNGSCLFENLAAGDYELKTSHQNYTDQSVTINVQNGIESTANLNLELSWVTDTTNLATVAGTILDKISGNPIINALVYTQPASSTALTDSSGEYKIKYVNPGEYNVIAEKNDYVPDSVAVSLKPGLTTNATILLITSKGTITGTILNSFQLPLAGVQIQTEPLTSTTTTGADGKFTISNIEYGSYKVIATKSGYVQQTADVNLLPNGTSTVEMIMNLE